MGGSPPPQAAMKTIYERLNPDILASIKADLDRYPASTGALIDNLQKANFWSELTMGSVGTIITHSHHSFMTLSHQDIVWGDKFLTNEEEETSNS